MCEYLVLSSAADNLFAGQTAVGKISSCLALNSISHLVNVTKDMMACSLIMTLLANIMSCLESTWSLTASNWSEKNVAINQPFANYMSHKVKKALALAMIWVARHLGDEPVLAVGSLSRDKQRSISQLLLSKRQCSCSEQVGGPAESQHCLYLQKFLNCIQSMSSAKTMTEKVQILFVLMQEEISRQDDLLRSCKLDRIALLRMFNAG